MYHEPRFQPLLSAAFAVLAAVLSSLLVAWILREQSGGFYFSLEEAQAAARRQGTILVVLAALANGALIAILHMAFRSGHGCATGALLAVILLAVLIPLNQIEVSRSAMDSPAVAVLYPAANVVLVLVIRWWQADKPPLGPGGERWPRAADGVASWVIGACVVATWLSCWLLGQPLLDAIHPPPARFTSLDDVHTFMRVRALELGLAFALLLAALLHRVGARAAIALALATAAAVTVFGMLVLPGDLARPGLPETVVQLLALAVALAAAFAARAAVAYRDASNG